METHLYLPGTPPSRNTAGSVGTSGSADRLRRFHVMARACLSRAPRNDEAQRGKGVISSGFYVDDFGETVAR